MSGMRLAALIGIALTTIATTSCGSSPPPKVEAPAAEETRSRSSGPTPQVSQELGSIDQRKVEQTFATLVQGPLESCHKQGRDRIEFLTGDVKVFVRIDASGRMRYGFFEETTLGDRETEKCILGVFASASWPKPDGGEAEVRSVFGGGPGGEREPTIWSSDRVTIAIVEAKDVKRDVDKCKGSVKGDFRITAYVEADEGHAGAARADDESEHAAKSKPARKPPPKRARRGDKEMGGRFKALGVAPPSKEGAEKIDCIVDALRPLALPSPGSYPAKVTFTL